MAETLRTSLPDGLRSWQTKATEEPEKQTRPAKRARVALACQRCKSRKQKVGVGFRLVLFFPLYVLSIAFALFIAHSMSSIHC